MYCIYTNRDVPNEEGNWDHVIPLSLGGDNKFVVWSERKINSTYGSQVDGALANDPLMMIPLSKSDVQGHAKRRKPPRWSKSTIGERPGQVEWAKNGPRFWDAMSKSYLDDANLIGQTITTQLKIDFFVALRFLSKVSLGAGYFVYGQEFGKAVDCQNLRKLSLLDAEAARQDQALRQSGIMICDRFHTDSRPGGAGYIYRVLCEQLYRSACILVPHEDGLSFHVGVAGVYIGSLICPGDGKALPMEGDHDLGHVIVLGPGEMERHSFRKLCAEFLRAATGEESPNRPEPRHR
nr:hypothetical protein RAR13_09540 [Aminobacter aminovorans]